MRLILIAAVLWGLALPSLGHCAGEKNIYGLARAKAKNGQSDFAFMYYRSILKDYPASRYAAAALFAHGEYYFFLPDYEQAVFFFNAFIERFPASDGKMFALAHLLKIARLQGQEALARDLEKEIVVLKQVSLVFRDFKEYKYLTPLYRSFRAVFHIDRVEFYSGGELFEEIKF